MRKLIFIFAAVGLGISSTANSQTTYNITGGDFVSTTSWNNNATASVSTNTYDNGDPAPAAVVGGTPGIVNWSPSQPGTMTGTYSGSITVDGSNNVTGGTLTVTGVIGYETQVSFSSWWYNEHTGLVIDFDTNMATSTYACYETAVAPAGCAGGASTPADEIFSPIAGAEGVGGAAVPAAVFDGTTLEIFHEGYAAPGPGTDILTTWTLTTGPAGPGASGGDITEAGDLAGVGLVAHTVDDVTSGVGVDIIVAATGTVASTIEYFDMSPATWDLIAIDTVADANSNGTADDPAIALLAQSQATGQIVVQTRATSDGSIVGSWMPFFNNSNWTPIDVAVVNDINGDGTTGDTGIAVLAENIANGSYQVRMKLLSNGSQTFKRNFFDANWTASAIEAFTASGGGGSRIAVMAVDGSGKTKAQVRDVSGGALDIAIFAFGSAIVGADLGVIADGDDNGTADDPALLFYGSRVSNGNVIYRSRSAASGAHIKTKEMLGTGFTPDAVTSLTSAGASAADDIAGTAVDGSDVQNIKVRDYRNNLTVADLLP